MLPTQRGQGQLLHRDHHLCDVVYEIDYPLAFANVFHIQRLRFMPANQDANALLALSDLTFVTEEGIQHPLPPTLEMTPTGHLQCTLTPNQ
jgi:hypothetical protein